MSDARSLLRQQRTARRITHPAASYTDAGKLICTICREVIKTESLWDGHISSEAHRKRVELQKSQRPPTTTQQAQPTQENVSVGTQKRKHGDDDDHKMGNAEGGADTSADDAPRHKRSKADMTSRNETDTPSPSNATREKRTSPPPSASLSRRSSQTPSQGIELQIPSRPATPRDSSSSSSSATTTTTTLPSRTAQPTSTTTGTQDTIAAPVASKGKPQIDEDEWAAFEADIAAADTSVNTYDDATISAPAMTAEESERQKNNAASTEDEDPRRRFSNPEADLADEKEDFRRQLEEEMDEMKGLEAKVLKLKERRDALRQRAASQGQEGGAAAAAALGKGAAASEVPGKENEKRSSVAVVEEEDEDGSDEEDDDDWDGFRFRT